MQSIIESLKGLKHQVEHFQQPYVSLQNIIVHANRLLINTTGL